MKIIKRILAFIGILIAVLLIAALFIKKEYKVERQISINRSKQDVFDYVKLIKNQDYYSKWVMTDPKMKKDFRGTDGTAGFIYAWDSEVKAAGKGEQEIKNVVPGSQLDCEVRFEKPMEGVAITHMITDSAGANQTKVVWAMEGKSKYPFNLMNLFIDRILGGDMESSLSLLKTNLEKK